MKANIVAGVSYVIALVCDFLGVHALMAAPFWFSELTEACIFHGAALAFGFLAMMASFPPSYRESKTTSFLLLCGFAGPLPVMGLVFLGLFLRLMKQQRVENPEKNYYFGERQVLTLLRFDEPGKGNSQSVLEILGGHDNKIRRNAILALRAVEAKKALPVLQKAIQDSDEQVRLLAQTQFNKIIQALELNVKKMEAELAVSGPEPFKLMQLAEQYHELVYLGISSEETESIYLQRAIDLLEQAVKFNAQNLQAKFLLLKCYIKNRKLPEAQAALDDLKNAGYQPEFLAPWECDVYFQERNWPALEDTLQEMQRRNTTDPRLRRLIDMWVSQPVSA